MVQITGIKPETIHILRLGAWVKQKTVSNKSSRGPSNITRFIGKGRYIMSVRIANIGLSYNI
jgi:hypothetical protein